MIKIPYKAIFSARRSTVLFQNAADQELLISMGLVNPDHTNVIGSSGVDLNLFRPTIASFKYKDPPIILFPSRLIREKGIFELLQAMNSLSSQGLLFNLWIAGEIDAGNRSSLTKLELEKLKSLKYITFLGHISDTMHTGT